MRYSLTEDILLATGAVGGVSAAAARHLLGENLLLVADETTWGVAGRKVLDQLSATHSVTFFSLGDAPHAALGMAQEIARQPGISGFFAVGSGTVNDVTKYAATLAEKPYISVATAASMNGYVSASASLEDAGFKRSYPAAPPRALVADLEVIRQAPLRLGQAGLGDTLCRATVEADMRLAHVLLGAAFPSAVFQALRACEEPLMLSPRRLLVADAGYYEALMHALLCAGRAMAETGSSAVASQAEHMLAHSLEALNVFSPGLLHGETIALTSVALDALQRRLLAQPFSVRALPRDEAVFVQAFGDGVGPTLPNAYRQKLLKEAEVPLLNGRLRDDWSSLRDFIAKAMHPPGVLEAALQAAGLTTSPQQFGLDAARYAHALRYAYLTRERFTFLDVAAMQAAD